MRRIPIPSETIRTPIKINAIAAIGNVGEGETTAADGVEAKTVVAVAAGAGVIVGSDVGAIVASAVGDWTGVGVGDTI